MTVEALIEALSNLRPEAEVHFAHCAHFFLTVDDVSEVGSDCQLLSHGWSDDCDCDGEV